MIDGLVGLISKFVPNKDLAKKLEAKVQNAHTAALSKAVEADKDVKIAELKAGGIAAKWRPIGALSIFGTLFLHWFIYPLCRIIVGLFNLNVYLPQLESLPLEYYGLALAFVSIYAHGRSMEKRM